MENVSSTAVAITIYAIWIAATDHLKRSPPDSLPSWPLWLLFWPVWTVLRGLGVTQAVEFEEPLDPTRKYMFCCVPHGAYAFSGVMWIGPQFRLRLNQNYEKLQVFFGVASVIFLIPGIREVMLLMGCREITKRTAVKLAQKNTPYSMAMLPGGIHEQIFTQHDEERHYVQKRLGFIRLALELGLDILPMYGFNENQVFTTHKLGITKWLFRKFGIGAPLVTGRYGFTPIPHPVKVTHVYGKPIKLKASTNPTDEEIEEVYVKYKAEINRIFKTHAPRLLPPAIAAKGIQVIRIGVDKDDRT